MFPAALRTAATRRMRRRPTPDVRSHRYAGAIDKGPSMNTWTTALREGSVAGGAATLLSLAVLALAGRRENGSAVAPVNAVGHWLWGDEALRADEASLRHTGTGVVTHLAAGVFWAALYSRLWGQRPAAGSVPQAIAGGIATSAVAFAVDYGVVPKRLTPGFEHRLDAGAMLATYASLAAGLALGAVLLGRRRR
jgi:hypothetical protein